MSHPPSPMAFSIRVTESNKKRARLITLAASVIAFASVAGCSRPWEKVNDDTPWVGPNLRAVQERRVPGFFDEYKPSDFRWVGPDGKVFARLDVARQAGSYLLDTEVGRALKPESGQFPWMTIVSVDPTVVLMVPVNMEQVKLGDLLGRTRQIEELPMVPGGAIHCDYGTTTFHNPGIRWFSPDLKRPPTDLKFSEGVGEIPLPDGKLEVRWQGQVCKIIRK